MPGVIRSWRTFYVPQVLDNVIVVSPVAEGPELRQPGFLLAGRVRSRR